MTKTFAKEIESVETGVYESYSLGPTLTNVMALLARIKSAPDVLQGADRKAIEEHFRDVIKW